MSIETESDNLTELLTTLLPVISKIKNKINNKKFIDGSIKKDNILVFKSIFLFELTINGNKIPINETSKIK